MNSRSASQIDWNDYSGRCAITKTKNIKENIGCSVRVFRISRWNCKQFGARLLRLRMCALSIYGGHKTCASFSVCRLFERVLYLNLQVAICAVRYAIPSVKRSLTLSLMPTIWMLFQAFPICFSSFCIVCRQVMFARPSPSRQKRKQHTMIMIHTVENRYSVANGPWNNRVGWNFMTCDLQGG